MIHRRFLCAVFALALVLTACSADSGETSTEPPKRLGTVRTADGSTVNRAAASALEDMASSMAQMATSISDLQSQVDILNSSIAELEKKQAETASSLADAEKRAESESDKSDSDSSSDSSSSSSSEEEKDEPKETGAPKVPDVSQKLTQAKRSNSDSQLWLQIPGTSINDVVVRGSNNTAYSKRDWMGNLVSEQRQENAVVLDFECAVGAGTAAVMPQNTVIYGVNFGTWLTAAERSGWGDFYQEHYNAQTGEMVYNTAAEEEKAAELVAACERLTLDDPNGAKFSQLLKFTDIDFARKTPYIYLTSSAEDLIYEVFAVSYTSSNVDPPYNLASYSDTYFMSLVEDMQEKSIYDYDVDVSHDDKILTLVTDTFRYAGRRDVYGARAKFIVMARLMQDDDTYHDGASLTANTAPAGPQFA